MMLQTDHLPVEQQLFDTALAYRYIGRRQIRTRHNVMRKARELSSQYLPVDEEVAPVTQFRKLTLFILLVLSKGGSCGYAILTDVQALSEGWLVHGTGTLHFTLTSLPEQWVIRKSAGDGWLVLEL